MTGLEGTGRVLIVAGAVIIILGLVLAFSGKLPFLGRLPGDILIRRDGFSFYFPVVTFLIISVIVTIIVNVVMRLFK